MKKNKTKLSTQTASVLFFFFKEFEYFSNFVKFCTMKLCDNIKNKNVFNKTPKTKSESVFGYVILLEDNKENLQNSVSLYLCSCWQASACDGAIFGCGAILDFHAQLPVGEMVNIPGFNPSPQ